MAGFLNEVKACNELKVYGVLYRFRFNEVRKKVGAYWALVARLVDGRWEVL